jgi:hypothetical protein
MTLKHVERGSRSLSHYNSLVDQTNANTPPGAAGAFWASGSHGSVLLYPPRGGSRFKYFELYDSLAPGGTSQAYPMEFDSDSGLYVTQLSEDTFPVIDVGSRFRGRARGVESGWDGSKGLAINRNGGWEIEWLQDHAIWALCLVSSKFETDDEFISVDTVSVIGPTDQALLMFSVTQALNIHDWSGGFNQVLQIRWDDGNERWIAVQKDCGSGVASGA